MIISAQEWIENIPSGWGLSKLKRLSSIRGRIGFRGYNSSELVGPEEGALTIGGKHINTNNELGLSDPTFLSWKKYYESPEISISVGDIVFVQRGSLGKVALIKDEIGPATINPSMILLTKMSLLAVYLYWVLVSKIVQDQVDTASSATAVPMISQENFGNFYIPVPPKNDQNLIASFLDRETFHIDSLIAKKEHQIELLQEKRSALINHAVTKGLNPDAKMKDSEIDWLGKIPESWKIIKLKYLSQKIGSGKTPRGGSEVYVDSGVMLLRSQNIYFDGLKLDDIVFIDEKTNAEMAATVTRPLDILLNITGASIGRCNFIPKDFDQANVNQHVCIIRSAQNKVFPQFLWLSICSKLVQSQIFSNQTGSSREGLNFQQVGNLIICMPHDIKEQKNLSIKINNEIKKFDVLIRKIENSILKLYEYHTALITAAVTGKIDVRKEAT